jgi:prephenate dehydrogenase
MKELSKAHITIIGLGLMGGSLAASLRQHCERITGIDKNPDSLVYAKKKGWIDKGLTSLDKGWNSGDVFILSTPVRTIMRHLDEIARNENPECLVIDIGSTKREIIQRMESLPPHIQSIGGHPMCGREVAGISQADGALFQGHPFILVPHSQTKEETVVFAKQIIQSIGAYPVIMDPKKHDLIVAVISHLPYLLACGLVDTAEVTAQEENDLVWELCAGGFQDTSRLAASDITMMVDILLTNRKAILNAVNQFQKQLTKLEHLIAAEEEDSVREILEKIYQRRNQLFK